MRLYTTLLPCSVERIIKEDGTLCELNVYENNLHPFVNDGFVSINEYPMQRRQIVRRNPFNHAYFVKKEIVDITKQYEQLYGLKSENITNKRMADIIKKSELYKNLSKALGQYSLKLGKVDVEDIICVSYLENDRKRFKSQLPFLLDASVCVKIANPSVE